MPYRFSEVQDFGPEIAVIGIVFNMVSSLRNSCSSAELCLLAAFRLLPTGLARQNRNQVGVFAQSKGRQDSKAYAVSSEQLQRQPLLSSPTLESETNSYLCELRRCAIKD
jgi:hypothetical protein